MNPKLLTQNNIFIKSQKVKKKRELKYQRTRADNQQQKLKRNYSFLSFSIHSNMKTDV